MVTPWIKLIFVPLQTCGSFAIILGRFSYIGLSVFFFSAGFIETLQGGRGIHSARPELIIHKISPIILFEYS